MGTLSIQRINTLTKIDMRYFYYRLWRNFSRIPTNDTPAFNAMILLSCIIIANIIALLLCVNNFIRLNVLYKSKNDLIILSIFFSLGIFAINYFLLYKKKDQIAEKYKNETRQMKILGSVLLFLYIIASFILLYAVSKIFPVS